MGSKSDSLACCCTGYYEVQGSDLALVTLVAILSVLVNFNKTLYHSIDEDTSFVACNRASNSQLTPRGQQSAVEVSMAC